MLIVLVKRNYPPTMILPFAPFSTRAFLVNLIWIAGLYLTQNGMAFPIHRVGGRVTTTTSQLGTSNDVSDDTRAVDVSAAILQGLRNRTVPLNGSYNPPKLNVETHLYDPTTGLHSEGVWHNCMVGLASLSLLERGMDDEPQDAATRIADALWKYSWDGISFQRRAHSGLWDHSVNADEQPHYYQESSEHRCVQHGMACVFWSNLVTFLRKHRPETVEPYEQQYETIATSFVSEFWNGKRFRTISASQGGGTTLRRSASSNMPTQGVTDPIPYYRAVDQAVGILACLEMLQQDQNNEAASGMLKATVGEILDEFGYADDLTTRSYIGLDRNRNFWHDGWVLLALVCARHQELSLQERLPGIWNTMLARYQHLDSTTGTYDGTVWHWPTSLKAGWDEGNVQYSCDNALLYAITRGLSSRTQADEGLWKFVHELRSRDEDGLASVADVYKQVRLHPNTELAALLLWQVA